MATVTIRPDADGDDVAWTALSGADWENVDEVIADDATTYIEVATATVADTDELLNLGASGISALATIDSVELFLRVRRLVGGTDPTLNYLWKENGVKTVGGSRALSEMSFIDISESLAVRPSDGGAWTLTDVDALQIGIRRQGNVTHGGIRCTQAWAVVTFTPPATEHAKRVLLLLS